MKKIYLLASAMLMLTTFLVFNACRNTAEDTYSMDGAKKKTAFNKTNGTCYCDPFHKNSLCDDCISGEKGIMQNQKTITYELTWTECKSNDPNWAPCKSKPTKKTKLTFCYGDPKMPDYNKDECELYMQIDEVPECLRCITYTPFCEKLRAKCIKKEDGSQEVTLEYISGGVIGTIEYEIAVVGDPKITFKCNAYGTNGMQYYYECTGQF